MTLWELIMLWGFLQTYEMSLPSSKKSKGIAMKVSLNEKIEVEHINTTEKEKFVLPLKNKLKKPLESTKSSLENKS